MRQINRVLVVDDETAFAERVSVFLADNGYGSRFAVDAGGALRATREFRPELLLLDFAMRQANALALLLSVRSVTPECRLVLTTPEPNDDLARGAQAAGALDILIKPFPFAVLLDTLGRVTTESERVACASGVSGCTSSPPCWRRCGGKSQVAGVISLHVSGGD